MAPKFPKGSVIREVNLEPAIMFGAGRALMLQIAHEAVAQGVDEHSDFKGNPFKRLLGTLEAVYSVVMGSEELAAGIGRRIQWIHTFIVGPTYSANDPANLMWVHATLADTALRCYEELIRPLTPVEREAYYEEMTEVAEVFGCPRSAQPADFAAFRAYVDETMAALDVSAVGKELAAYILDPTLPLGLHVPLRPLLTFQRRYTLGSLPASIRDQLTDSWSDADQARYEQVQRRARQLFAITPAPLRTAGPRLNGLLLMALAKRHVRQFDERQASRAEARPAA